MADPASLVLAIAPLVLEAFKGFRTLGSKLRIFSHYSQELKRIRTRFEAQQDFFESECEILLRKITDSQSQVEAFLRARQFDDDCYDTLKRLCTYLGPRQKAFEGTFEDIKASLQGLDAELHGFERFESERQDGESLRDAVRRLRYRLKITINKTNYDEALERLKQSNYDLKSMRKHAQELRRDVACAQDVAKDIKPLPLECRHFRRVRLAALTFHEAMVTHWVCEERKHQRHLLRLFTNAEVQHDVKMNFFLLGERESPEAICPKLLDLISLEVRSTIVECSEPLESENRSRKATTMESRVIKRRRVRWADETPASTISYSHLFSNLERHRLISHDGMDAELKAQDHRCANMPGCAIAAQQLRGPACLGHLDVEMQKPFRHSFYAWSGICNRSMTVAKTFAAAEPLTNLFNQPVHKNFDVLDQLLLAKTMVATILKFHSTPWLGSWWTLKDIHYLGNHDEMASVLSTLHLGSVIERKQKQVCKPPELLPLTRTVAGDSGRSQRIRNTVLHNLGVGLLEIDRWTNLDPNAIDNIDKLATQRSRFGPKYRDLVQKCLYCDFGVGADLLKPQLQIAVLDKVMRELESMISGLKINDDEAETQ
ncbi:hypothetical protein EV127DRAFT_395970 [Xylaria flabelliformis]|nr:hypothetical protein EV127DRAFT_395970 [Xylaria flabelliformis]